MHPSHPGENRDDLIAYVDGEADPATAEEIRGNPAWAAEAVDYATLQGQLQQRLYRFDCPSSMTLGDYELGLLAPEERTQVAAHATECPRCMTELRTLRVFLADEPDAPPLGIGARVRSVVATLLPAPLSPVVRLRGNDDDGTRTYRAGDVTIALDTGAALVGGRGTIAGLLWRDSGDADTLAGSVVTLRAGNDVIQRTALDDLGNFTFDDLAPATYVVELVLGDVRIRIENVRFGS